MKLKLSHRQKESVSRICGLVLINAMIFEEILADNDVGSRLGPVRGSFDVALLENDRALIVTDRG